MNKIFGNLITSFCIAFGAYLLLLGCSISSIILGIPFLRRLAEALSEPFCLVFGAIIGVIYFAVHTLSKTIRIVIFTVAALFFLYWCYKYIPTFWPGVLNIFNKITSLFS